MSTKQLKTVLTNIESWLSKKMLYYSVNRHKFYIGYYAGMGNFDVNELPSEYQDLIVNSEVEKEEVSHLVLSQLSLINKKSKDIEPYTAQMAKVAKAQPYGYEHDLNLISAMRFAAIHHALQKRKSSDEPYLNHLIEVAQLIQFYEPTTNETTLMAAALHDIVEDTRVTIESIELLFGSEVAKLVSELTCDVSVNSDDKKAQLLDQISAGSDSAKIIKLADLISNTASIPKDWPIEQTQKYLSWCKKVARECASASPRLYERFSSLTEAIDSIEITSMQPDALLSSLNQAAECLFNAEFDYDNEKFKDLKKLALEYFKTPEDARLWFNTTNRSLGYITPLTLLKTEIGLQQVENCIIKLIHGMTC